MKVLVAESMDEKVLAEFRGGAVEFVYKPDISPLELETGLAGYSGLIVRPKPVSGAAVMNAADLKLVIRGGAGVNSIALDACRERGVVVENTPGLNSDATAEFTVLLMLQVFGRRQAERADELIRRAAHELPEDYMGRELKGKKLGLVGAGNIAVRVAKIAAAFGMDVVIFARSQKPLPYAQVGTLAELLAARCDIISLHVPLNADTVDMIGEAEFAAMKPGTILINTARPQLVEVAAFGKALASGQLGGFGIDGDYELVMPFVVVDKARKGIITHHIADSTFEAQANITRAALSQAVAFFEKGEEINRVV